MIFMDKKDRGSISIMKIIGVSLIFILIFGVSVLATEMDMKSVEVTMANGYTAEMAEAIANIEELNNSIIGGLLKADFVPYWSIGIGSFLGMGLSVVAAGVSALYPPSIKRLLSSSSIPVLRNTTMVARCAAKD